MPNLGIPSTKPGIPSTPTHQRGGGNGRNGMDNKRMEWNHAWKNKQNNGMKYGTWNGMQGTNGIKQEMEYSMVTKWMEWKR